MQNGQIVLGKNNFFLILIFLFIVTTVGFIVFNQGGGNGNVGNISLTCPPVPSCPPCTSFISNADNTVPYAPRPFIKSAQDAFMEKLKRHEIKSLRFYPWLFYESTYECKMGEDRIGFPGEGGKWICGMANLLQKPNCVVYSMGSNGQHDFEDDIMMNTACEIHTFDMDDFSKVFNGTRVHFHKSKIGDGTGGTQTISYWMKTLGHKHIDVLKIDIEHGEYPAFDHLLKQYPLPWIGQVLIEFHLLDCDWGRMTEEQKYKAIDKNLRLIENLHNLGLVQYHREENPYGRAHEYCYGNLKPRPPV